MPSASSLHSPLVAIALAAYEPSPAWLRQQLQSLQWQTHKNWICHVTFDSPMQKLLVDPLLTEFSNDQRFHFSENGKRLGYKLNFEQALNLCLGSRAEYIAFCDQDDVWYPNKIEMSLQALASKKSGMAFCNFRRLSGGVVSAKDGWSEEHRDVGQRKQWDLVTRNIGNGCSQIFDAGLAARFKKIPDLVKHHDQWMMLVFENFGELVAVKNPGFSYRQHSENQIGSIEYSGLLSINPTVKKNLLQELRMAYRESHDVALSLQSQKMLKLKTWFLYLTYDLGLFLFLQTLMCAFLAPRTAKTYLARALGKALDQTLRSPASQPR